MHQGIAKQQILLLFFRRNFLVSYIIYILGIFFFIFIEYHYAFATVIGNVILVTIAIMLWLLAYTGCNFCDEDIWQFV